MGRWSCRRICPRFIIKMAYLELARALNMNKVTISLWFRIPSQAVEAIYDDTPGFFWDFRVLHNVIPLITWGPQTMGIITLITVADTGYVYSSGTSITYNKLKKHTAPMSPSFIGVRVTDLAEPLLLDVHIQTDDRPAGTGLARYIKETIYAPTGFIYTDLTNPSNPNNGKPIADFIKFVYEDCSEVYTDRPDYLGNSDATSSSSGAGHPEVTADRWHHLLDRKSDVQGEEEGPESWMR